MSDNDSERPADWGTNEPVTARQLRYVMNELGAALIMVIATILSATAIIAFVQGTALGLAIGLLVYLGMVYIIVLRKAYMTDGWERSLLGRFHSLNEYPIEDIEPESKTKDRTLDELLNE